MTDEQLAEFIQQGGNEELLPILWERIRKLMYMKSDKVYRAYQSDFIRCGADVWDLKQSCYMAFLEAVRGYKADKGLKFTAYLSYPFRNVVNNLIGVRTKTKQNEPLNNCTSLEMPVSDDENLTLADTLIDETAVNAVDVVEQEDEYRILHEVVDSLQPPLNDIVNAYYFEGKTYKQIGEEMGVSHSTVSSYSAKAMRCLRASPILKELYRENKHHEELNSWQNVQTRPDFHLYISELEENYRMSRQRRI